MWEQVGLTAHQEVPGWLIVAARGYWMDAEISGYPVGLLRPLSQALCLHLHQLHPSYLLQVLIEEIENRVGVAQLLPLLHMLVPGPIGHYRMGGSDKWMLTWAGLHCPSYSLIPRPTFPGHELLQEAVPGPRVGVHFGHAVEVVIGDSHILGISGNIDSLERQTKPPAWHLTC